jgi:hypothetical protein
MSLNDFLADEATGKSWADDVDDLPLARECAERQGVLQIFAHRPSQF